MESKVLEELKKYIAKRDLRYGKLTFTIQDGKILDEITETRIRL
jgi:hypothetical protein